MLILFPFLKNNAELLGENEKHFAKEVIWSEGLEVHKIIPFPVWNILIELFMEYKKRWKKKFFIPSIERGVNNSISCLEDSIYCCAFQNNDDLLTMVSFEGKLKTDSFAWVLMQVYYQIEIPSPVSHSKSGKKLGLNEFVAY